MIELNSVNHLAHKTTVLIDGQPLQGAKSTELVIEAGDIIRLTLKRNVLNENGSFKLNADRTGILEETLVYTGRIELKLHDAKLLAESELAE